MWPSLANSTILRLESPGYGGNSDWHKRIYGYDMRVVIEEGTFLEDKEKLGYSAEELDKILGSVIEDIANKPEEFHSIGLNSGMATTGGDSALYIWFTFDGDCVHLLRIWECPS